MSRELAGTTAQRVADGFVQAGSSIRELRSTVVVQSSQQEKEVIQTRSVTNYNHCHTLTVLYYEVLRHYRVETAAAGVTPVVLVRYPLRDFTREDLLNHRDALAQALADPALTAGLAAAETLQSLPPPPPPPPPTPPRFVTSLLVRTTTGNDDSDSTGRLVNFTVLATGGRLLAFNARDFKVPTQALGDESEYLLFRDRTTNSFLIPRASLSNLSLGEVRQVGVHYRRAGKDQWRMVAVRFYAEVDSREWVLIGESAGEVFFEDDGDLWVEAVNTAAPAPPAPPAAPDDSTRRAAEAAEGRLLDHLNRRRLHYWRAVWLTEDPNERAERFEGRLLPGGKTLLDTLAENRPLEVLGSWVAFPVARDALPTPWREGYEKLNKDVGGRSELRQTRLVSLPTRGVFAEAELGRCNGCEEINKSRFWDWQTSPIPNVAPQIAPAQPVTPQPQQPNLQPSGLPAPVVNVVTPPAAPAPSGLGPALAVLSTPDIFRDMSGRREVAELLGRLSDNSVQIGEAAAKARQIRDRYGDDLLKTTPAVVTPAASSGSVDSRLPAADARDVQQFLDAQKQKGNITPEQHADLSADVSSKAVGQPSAPTPLPAPTPKPVKVKPVPPSRRSLSISFHYDNKPLTGTCVVTIKDVDTGKEYASKSALVIPVAGVVVISDLEASVRRANVLVSALINRPLDLNELLNVGDPPLPGPKGPQQFYLLGTTKTSVDLTSSTHLSATPTVARRTIEITSPNDVTEEKAVEIGGSAKYQLFEIEPKVKFAKQQRSGSVQVEKYDVTAIVPSKGLDIRPE